MQLVLLCVLVLSLLQPGLLQDGGTEDTRTNGNGGDLFQGISELKNIVLAQSKQIADFSQEVRGQLATLNVTVNTLQGQLESLTGDVAKNRWRINLVRKTAESEQAVSQNISTQLDLTADQLSTELNQLRTELTANQRKICEKVDGVSSQQLRIQNESVAQLQILYTTLDNQLTNATDQLSNGLKQLKRELTTYQQSSDLSHNRTQVQSGAGNISPQDQCQQTSMEPSQDSLATPLQTYTCGGSSGWRRVAFLNMADPCQDCPSGWNLTTHSVRTCGRASHGSDVCDPVTFPVSGGEYSRVCGRARAYQYGTAQAFRGANIFYRLFLDDSYVTGISITHGLPRQHIWTFAVGLAQEYCCSYYVAYYCNCDVQTHSESFRTIPLSYVGNDYFCESGVSGRWERNVRLYSENPLWDGQNCGQNSTCCSMNDPPYFMKDLPAPTTDDIEVRLCSTNYPHLSDVPIELLELYVQ